MSAPTARVDARADARPSDRAGPLRIGLVSVHTSPLEQAGRGDAGGMNVSLVALGRELALLGAEVHVFTRKSSGDLPPSVRTADGVVVHHLEAGPPGVSKEGLATHLCAFYLALAAHPVTPHLDLLHGHYWMSGWVSRLARRRLGLPVVQSFHTLARVKNAALAPRDLPESALRIAAEQRVVDDADALLAATASEAHDLRHHYRARAGSVTVIEPGVDLDVFRGDIDRDAARRDLGGGRIVLFVGRLQPLKGPDVAIRALAALRERLASEDTPVRLVVVGGTSGPGAGAADPATLAGLARSLGIEDRVGFLAARPQTELAPLYAAADVVIVPSRSESFGLVALEAQASGTPVVAAKAGGLVHAVAPGAGTLVAGYEPQAWAEALLPYVTDAALRDDAGRRGRAHAAGLSWRRTAVRTLAVYRSVLAPPVTVTHEESA